MGEAKQSAGGAHRIPSPLALILGPTRELVVQISEEAAKLVWYSKGQSSHAGGIGSCCIYGGKSKQEQLRRAQKGAHIMAATPGRLAGHVENKEVMLQNVSYF